MPVKLTGRKKAVSHELRTHSYTRRTSMMKLTVQPKTVALMLLAIAAALALVGIVIHFTSLSFPPSKLLKHLDRLFNLDEEANIPTVFSAGLLFSAAVLLSLIASAKRRDRYFLHWLGLAVIFFFLALDESVQLHESIINAMRAMFRASGYFYFAWIIPYGVFALLVFLAYLRFVRDLPSRIRALVAAAAFCYVGGAIGFEMLEGKYWGQPHWSPFIDMMLIASEEFLEMCGIILLVYALLSYTRIELGSLEIRLIHKEA
jgi:hypothetical protein